MWTTEQLIDPEENEEKKNEVNETALRALKQMKNNFKPDKKALELINVARGLKEKPIVIAKADKSNNVVIMNKQHYSSKMTEMIAESNYERLEKNPLKTFKNRVDKVLKEYAEVLCNEPKKELRRWKTSNPKIPRLYRLAKTHKMKDLTNADEIKMRPVASNTDATTEKIAKKLVKEFKKLEPPEGKSVKNALEFVKAVKNVKVRRNETMGSYDVKSLYPSIPLKKTFVFLEMWLIKNNLPRKKIEAYMSLTKLCMEQNVFTFEGAVYIQRGGTAIGNALSGFLAEIYIYVR